MLIEVVAGYLRYAVTQHQVALHGRTAQVKVAVLQTNLVADFLGVVNLKRGGLRLGQNADVLGNNFDLAGRHLLVDSRLVTSNQLALDSYNELGAAGEGNVEQVSIDRLVERALYNARTVAQQQEKNAAVVAHAVNPAVNGNGLTGVLQAKIAAHVRALHACNRCVIHVLSILISKYFERFWLLIAGFLDCGDNIFRNVGTHKVSGEKADNEGRDRQDNKSICQKNRSAQKSCAANDGFAQFIHKTASLLGVLVLHCRTNVLIIAEKGHNRKQNR